MESIKQKLEKYIKNAKENTVISAVTCEEALASLDLTSLNDNDTPEVIKKLCNQAKKSPVPTASVCVYPQFVKVASEELNNTTISIATVINFPKGEDSIDKIVKDTVEAIQNGANEIDLVWNYKAYMNNEKEVAKETVRKCKEAIVNENEKNNGKVLLKIILETGALMDMKEENAVYNASLDAINSGADIIKTSTGKIAKGASLEAAGSMLLAISKIKKDTGKVIGLKVSGGVRTCQQAAEYISLFNEVLNGEDKENTITISKSTFRIGASSVFNSLIAELKKF